jgi:hypothetical protein
VKPFVWIKPAVTAIGVVAAAAASAVPALAQTAATTATTMPATDDGPSLLWVWVCILVVGPIAIVGGAALSNPNGRR